MLKIFQLDAFYTIIYCVQLNLLGVLFAWQETESRK